jgi:hypothetical protein
MQNTRLVRRTPESTMRSDTVCASLHVLFFFLHRLLLSYSPKDTLVRVILQHVRHSTHCIALAMWPLNYAGCAHNMSSDQNTGSEINPIVVHAATRLDY